MSSTYSGGRRAPNVSQYLRDLNSINPQEGDEPFGMDHDLTRFTNTEFFDYDSGQNLDFQAQPVKVDVASAEATPAAASEDPSSAASAVDDMLNLDFIPGEFHFSNFDAYSASPMNAYADNPQNFQPLQPNHGPVFAGRAPPQPQQQQQSRYNHATARAADKREPDTPASQSVSLEDASRAAADDDKRRRNTAASARFRIKKKQREQALEKSAKEMTDRVNGLESKVSQLETENKWLKNLLVEKNEGNEDITALWKEFTKHASKRTKAAKEDAKADS